MLILSRVGRVRLSPTALHRAPGCCQPRARSDRLGRLWRAGSARSQAGVGAVSLEPNCCGHLRLWGGAPRRASLPYGADARRAPSNETTTRGRGAEPALRCVAIYAMQMRSATDFPGALGGDGGARATTPATTCRELTPRMALRRPTANPACVNLRRASPPPAPGLAHLTDLFP